MCISPYENLLNRADALQAIDPRSNLTLEFCFLLQDFIGEISNAFSALLQTHEKLLKSLENPKQSAKAKQQQQHSLLSFEIELLEKRISSLSKSLEKSQKREQEFSSKLKKLQKELKDCLETKADFDEACRDAVASLYEEKEKNSSLEALNKSLERCQKLSHYLAFIHLAIAIIIFRKLPLIKMETR